MNFSVHIILYLKIKIVTAILTWTNFDANDNIFRKNLKQNTDTSG